MLFGSGDSWNKWFHSRASAISENKEKGFIAAPGADGDCFKSLRKLGVNLNRRLLENISTILF